MSPEPLEKKFALIYRAESDAIFRFCLLRVSEREIALDITQETFTRLWRTMNEGTSIQKERPFLFTVAHRLIIDWYRKIKPLPLQSLTNEETGEPYEPTEDGDREASDLVLEARFLLAAMVKVSDSYRQALYLRFAEGFSPAEIGEVLGLSPNAASVRLNRGLNELRKITGYDIDQHE